MKKLLSVLVWLLLISGCQSEMSGKTDSIPSGLLPEQPAAGETVVAPVFSEETERKEQEKPEMKFVERTVSEEKSENPLEKKSSEKKKEIAPAAEMPHSEDPQPEKPKNAEERDSHAIAEKLIEYLNEYRVAQGSPPAKVLTEYIPYAEYRSRQLGFHFAHDTMDEREAATVLKIGTYVNPADYGMDGDPYYTADVREAIGYSGFVGTVEEVARNLADMVRGSPAHWAYVGGAEYTGIAVGITYTSDLWYIDVAMKN